MALNGIFNTMVKSIKNLFSHSSVHSGSTSFVTYDLLPIVSISKRKASQYAVLILNRPLNQSVTFLTSFWNEASVRITVDGGTAHWDKFANSLPEDIKKKLKLPDLITGDFDSLSKDLLEDYKKKGCKIVQTPDQDYTDFTKAVIELHSYCERNKLDVNYVVAIAQSSGRVDHVLGNIQTLFLVKKKQLLGPQMSLFLLADDNLCWLLSPGNNIISIPKETLADPTACCGLMPIGEACATVKTTGLKWNLDDQPLEFGELVSTSNAFDGSEQVTVFCSHTLLWSMKIPTLFDDSSSSGFL